MQSIKLQKGGRIALPKKLRDALGLAAGQSLLVGQDGTNIVIEKATAVENQLNKHDRKI